MDLDTWSAFFVVFLFITGSMFLLWGAIHLLFKNHKSKREAQAYQASEDFWNECERQPSVDVDSYTTWEELQADLKPKKRKPRKRSPQGSRRGKAKK